MSNKNQWNFRHVLTIYNIFQYIVTIWLPMEIITALLGFSEAYYLFAYLLIYVLIFYLLFKGVWKKLT